MENLRRWEMNRGVAFNFQIAADARFSRTSYTDDQVWRLNLGSRDNPALAFQTQFGGRAGLASVVPMWILEGRTVYQYQTYNIPPIITHFAPGYLRAECTIVPELELVAQYWAMESRAAGGEYLLKNVGNEDIHLHLDLFGHVGINNRNRKLNVLTFPDNTIALHFGEIGNINPVLVLEGANLSVYGGYLSSPKIGCKVVIPAGNTVRIPFVIAGLSEMRDSVSLAMNWLARPWKPFFEQIDLEATAVPQISTGNDSWDKLLDLSFSHVINAFMKPTDNLPHPSFVATRDSNRGWSQRGDGSDHIRSWAGQDPTLAYLIAPVIANIEPNFAKSIIYNYLATQDDSGFVDRQPGLGGQRQGTMMMPLLVRLAWMIYQRTEDEQFLMDIYPKLSVFFKRWFNHDLDVDGDGVPEWNSERQMGYLAFPTFAMGQAWGQGANIRQMETPDLLAYLISEAEALHSIADTLGEKQDKTSFNKQLKDLEKLLKEFWDGKRYTYRDRDSHITSKGIQLLDGVAGDEAYTLDQSFVAPNRIVIRVVGGVSHRPKITLHIIAKDQDGNPLTIEASTDDFLWQNRQGMYTTTQALSHIESLKIDGLSRVYKIYAETIDSSRLDINHLLPLWTARLTKAQAKALVALAMDEEEFLRPSGLTMVSAQDSDFDASNANGGGGIWMYWLALVGEGMVKSGYHAEATQVIKRVLNNLSKNLANDGHLSQFYHADETKGFGEEGHIGGIVPLNLLMEVIGVRIISHRKVWVGGDFTWEQDITVRQHGVSVTRSADGIRVLFPSDHEITLDAEPKWQAVTDPKPVEEEPVEALELPNLPDISESESAKRVMIDVEGQEETKAIETEEEPIKSVDPEIDDNLSKVDSEPDDTLNP